jgi:hypothetical protein
MTDTNPPADRIAEIRARVAAAEPRPPYWRKPLLEGAEMDRHAPADVVHLLDELDKARQETADMRAALERRLLQVKSFRSEGHKRVNPMLCTTPVTTVEDEVEDARLWWQAVKHGTEANEAAAPVEELSDEH